MVGHTSFAICESLLMFRDNLAVRLPKLLGGVSLTDSTPCLYESCATAVYWNFLTRKRYAVRKNFRTRMLIFRCEDTAGGRTPETSRRIGPS